MMLNDTREVTTRTKFALFSLLTMGLVAASSPMGGSPDPCQLPRFDNPEYAVGRRPLSVATGDLDGDGDLDLVTANQFGDTVSLLLNEGNGTFVVDAVPVLPNVPGGVVEPFCAALGDLDGDGDLDLAVANAGGFGGLGFVALLFNNGSGDFADQINVRLAIDPFFVALGDLDGDGDLDMAVAVNGSDTLSVRFNNGDGTFVFGADLPAGDMPRTVATGDLDGDTDLDLVVPNWTQNVVSVFLNNGDGTFASRVTHGAGVRPISVAIGDLDRDGDLDLAVPNSGTNCDIGTTVSVLLNNGDGAFAGALPYGVGEFPVGVDMADLDGDGELDLAVSNKWTAGRHRRPGRQGPASAALC